MGETRMQRKVRTMFQRENTENSAEEHNSSDSIPSIDVSITTSSPKLDLAVPRKGYVFEVNLELTLHHTGPITFVWWNDPLFNGKILLRQGLDFIDVESGRKATRGEELCFFPVFCDGEPRGYRTLSPGKPRVFSDIICYDGYEWERAEGLKDGKQYDIKLGGCASLSNYFEGTTDEAIESFKSTGSIDFEDKTILLNQVNTPRISVSRSDGGGYESDEREWAAAYREFQRDLARYRNKKKK
jgi:hypothetical protein